ncbi:MAG TPA: carbonic anhydrase family protein [Candidatus Acidoferrum sp.]|jgi:carbonic anhydrase
MPQTFYRKSLFLILGVCIVAAPVRSLAQEAHPPHWTYKGPEDPKHWGTLDPAFATCSNGHHQSPIDIRNAKKEDLPGLKFDYNAVPLSIIDNGHTVMINYAPGSTLTVGDKVYKLTQFHFHHPSEEHINGKKFDMVAHLVHTDAEGHLAVVAVLFKEGAANPLLETLWKNTPTEKEKAVDLSSVSVNVKDLLPADRGYYTFSGSLTTPPCTEGVTWYVLKTASTISPEQLATFAKLYPADNRPIQPTYQREILETK